MQIECYYTLNGNTLDLFTLSKVVLLNSNLINRMNERENTYIRRCVLNVNFI